eukprot:2700638-Pleurochrysis_carterae.AAC.1
MPMNPALCKHAENQCVIMRSPMLQRIFAFASFARNAFAPETSRGVRGAPCPRLRQTRAQIRSASSTSNRSAARLLHL